MQNIKITVGTDPEFFVFDKKSGINCSAHDLVPGDKDKPHKLEFGAVQADGTAIEMNITPAETAAQFKEYNMKVLDQIRKMVPENYEFKYTPTVHYDAKYFESIPKASKELGCNPDWNAWEDKINPRPEPKGADEFMRSGAGHFHIGWTKDADVQDDSHRYDCRTIVKGLDQLVLPWMKLFDDNKDRARLYGKPGAMRYKPYGVEWRTPSNAWLNHPDIWEWLHESIVYTVRKMVAGEYLPGNYLYRDSSYYSITANIIDGGATYDEVKASVEKRCPGFPSMPKIDAIKDTIRFVPAKPKYTNYYWW